MIACEFMCLTDVVLKQLYRKEVYIKEYMYRCRKGNPGSRFSPMTKLKATVVREKLPLSKKETWRGTRLKWVTHPPLVDPR